MCRGLALGSGVFGGELVDGHPGGEPVEFGGHGRAVTGGWSDCWRPGAGELARRAGVGPAPWLSVVAGSRLGVMAGLAGWRWPRVVAWSLAGLTALVLAAALVLLGLDVPVMDAARVAIYVVCALAVAVSAGIGCLIATRLPASAIGWLLSVIGLSLAAGMFAELYALWGLAVAAAPHGHLPHRRRLTAGRVAVRGCGGVHVWVVVLRRLVVPGRPAAVAAVAAGVVGADCDPGGRGGGAAGG